MDHYHKGNELALDEYFEDAVAEYTIAANECADCCSILAYRSVAYVKLKKYMNALEDCNRVLQMDPQCERVHYRKG
jgi:predicted metal-binding protein